MYLHIIILPYKFKKMKTIAVVSEKGGAEKQPSLEESPAVSTVGGSNPFFIVFDANYKSG